MECVKMQKMKTKLLRNQWSHQRKHSFKALQFYEQAEELPKLKNQGTKRCFMNHLVGYIVSKSSKITNCGDYGVSIKK